MDFDIGEIVSSPAFWILGGGAAVATVLGWRMSAGFGASFPLWQIALIILVEFVAAAFFASQD